MRRSLHDAARDMALGPGGRCLQTEARAKRDGVRIARKKSRYRNANECATAERQSSTCPLRHKCGVATRISKEEWMSP